MLYGSGTEEVRNRYRQVSVSVNVRETSHMYGKGIGTCSVLVPYLFRSCPVPVPNLSRTCSVPVPYLSRTCSVPFPYLFRTFSVPVPYLFRTCPVPVPYLSRTCPVPVPYLFRTCPVPVPYLSRTCPVPVPYLSRTCPVPVPYLFRTCCGHGFGQTFLPLTLTRLPPLLTPLSATDFGGELTLPWMYQHIFGLSDDICTPWWIRKAYSKSTMALVEWWCCWLFRNPVPVDMININDFPKFFLDVLLVQPDFWTINRSFEMFRGYPGSRSFLMDLSHRF